MGLTVTLRGTNRLAVSVPTQLKEQDMFVLCMPRLLAQGLFSVRIREIRLEVSADKAKYMVMSRDQNAGSIHILRIDNSTFERVEEFKYLGTTLTHQNSIAEEIKFWRRNYIFKF